MRSGRRRAAVAVAMLLAMLTVACSSGDAPDGSPAVAADSVPVVVAPAAPPMVDRIDDAVAALEAQFGRPQRYFEINATARLVNLFVSFNGDTKVQPWVYLDGELSSTDVVDAQGFSFPASALVPLDDSVFGELESQLPGSTLAGFVIQGGQDDAIQYSVIVDSAAGGQLVAVVSADGAVLSVEPVS